MFMPNRSGQFKTQFLCESAGFKINYLRQAFPDIPYFFVDMKELGHGMAMDCISKEYCPSSKGFISWAKKKPVFYETIAGFPARVKFQENISCKVSSKKVR